MSQLNKLKGILLNELKGTNVEVRKAILAVFNSVDSDLDILGYEPSNEVDDAYEKLYKVLSEVDYDHDNPPASNLDITKAEIELPKLKVIDRSEYDKED